MKRPSPLVGYNTGVQYRGAPYHVQTEDSGIDHPHVITHLFAEGGRILATRKTSYAEHVGDPAYPEIVRRIIREQHKAMIVALRDGECDQLLGHASAAPRPAPGDGARAPHPARSPAPPPPPPAPPPTPRPPADTTPASTEPSLSRARRASFPDREASRDSLDEIIIADLVLHLDD